MEPYNPEVPRMWAPPMNAPVRHPQMPPRGYMMGVPRGPYPGAPGPHHPQARPRLRQMGPDHRHEMPGMRYPPTHPQQVRAAVCLPDFCSGLGIKYNSTFLKA